MAKQGGEIDLTSSQEDLLLDQTNQLGPGSGSGSSRPHQAATGSGIHESLAHGILRQLILSVDNSSSRQSTQGQIFSHDIVEKFKGEGTRKVVPPVTKQQNPEKSRGIRANTSSAQGPSGGAASSTRANPRPTLKPNSSSRGHQTTGAKKLNVTAPKSGVQAQRPQAANTSKVGALGTSVIATKPSKAVASSANDHQIPSSSKGSVRDAGDTVAVSTRNPVARLQSPSIIRSQSFPNLIVNRVSGPDSSTAETVLVSTVIAPNVVPRSPRNQAEHSLDVAIISESVVESDKPKKKRKRIKRSEQRLRRL